MAVPRTKGVKHPGCLRLGTVSAAAFESWRREALGVNEIT